MRRCLFSAGCLLLLLQFPVGAAPPDDLVLVPLISGLNSPVAVRHAGDGSGRLFIVEQAGIIRIWDGSEMLPTPFLNITAIVESGGEQGLLGLAFHPDYSSNGYFYVNYTYDPGAGLDRTRVARYSVSAGNPDVADTAETVLLEIEQDFSNHNGGDIHFGPDGYLYIGMGDGGSGGDPNDRAQDRTQLLGKMLRIDVDGAAHRMRGVITGCGLEASYGIPVDNPFVGDGNACDEIWAYGMRNPWRFSFDRHTGALFIGDVGQNMWEEIDLQPASSSGGENYGWRCYEGTHEYNLTDCSGPYVDPILEYEHTGGRCSVTGGYAYRGHGIGGFDGTYIYGDYCTGEIWFAVPTGGWSTVLWANTSFGISTFGEDEEGELYVADLFGGTVARFESPSTIFVDGFESGDISGW
ncbi:MAG: PQQ-dependent sugar dehydrogenase [Acidobacteriota bacterium]